MKKTKKMNNKQSGTGLEASAFFEGKLIVAIHKPYDLPKDEAYLPLFMGAVLKEPLVIDEITIAGDDEGDNISEKNPYYCELTGMYWAWKNLDAKYKGLVHYRRYFSNKSRRYVKKHDFRDCVLSSKELVDIMDDNTIIVPKKRRYYIESLASHYAHTHDMQHLIIARDIIARKYPNMLGYVDKAYNRTWGYMFNMFVMPSDLLDEYASFLFDVLEEMEPVVMNSKFEALSDFDKRLFGRVSEILFNAWVDKKSAEGVNIVEIAHIHTEPINWFVKGTSFLKAKFLGKKYKKGF